MTNKKKKLLCLGIDGLPLELIEALLSWGALPHLHALAKEQGLFPLRSTQPPVSNVAWTSWATGRGPGHHGIFGFTDLIPGTARITYPTFRDVTIDTVWDRLGRKGLTSLVLNLPGTYPARPLRGALIAGFVAVDLAKAVHPPSLLAPLQALGYETDVDVSDIAGRKEILLQRLHRSLHLRRQAFDLLIRREWDLAIAVITGTDRLHHLMWSDITDPQSPLHEQAVDYYRAVDDLVGYMLDRVGEAAIMALSDHGFCAIKAEVNVNAILTKAGLLSLEGPSLEALAPSSAAFALDPARIYLHDQRFPRGRLGPGDRDAVLAEVRAALLQERHGAFALFQDVLWGEDLYEGPCAARGPDLVAIPTDGYDPKATIRRPEILSPSRFEGMHTHHNAFIIPPRGMEAPREITSALDRAVELLLP